MNVLIAQHNVKVRSAMKFILREFGVDFIVESSDGEEAMQRLDEHQFDLVIVDWSLPTIGGIDITRHIRAQESGSQAHVLMNARKDQPEDVLLAVETGVNEYVLEPFDKDVMRAKLRRVLKVLKPDVA